MRSIARRPIWMEVALLESPSLVDLVLTLTAFEAAALILWHRKSGRGLTVAGIGRMLLPGIFLLLALRAALAGRAWPFVPLALSAALIAHLADLRSRWRE